MKFVCRASFLLVITLTLISIIPAFAGLSRHEVLLVVNEQSPISTAIGDYYQSARGVPEINVCHLTACPTNEWTDPQTYYDQIRTPIWNYLNDASHPWLASQVKAILLTKGVPLAFWADSYRSSSVDMPLCYMGNTCAAGTEPAGTYITGYPMFYNSYLGRNESFDQFWFFLLSCVRRRGQPRGILRSPDLS